MKSMEIIQLFLVMSAIGLLTWLIVHFADQADRKKRMEAKRNGLNSIFVKAQQEGFSPSQTIVPPNGAFCFSFDAQHKTFLLSYPGTDSYILYSFSDLLNYSLIQDGQTSGNGAAVLGAGLLFGTVGAVAAASSASSAKTCSDLRIELSVNDPKSPRHTMRFISGEVYTNSSLYRTTIEIARQALSILDYIKANAPRPEAEGRSKSPEIEEASRNSYDQVRQLFLLKEQGAISEEEYQKRKDSLLDI
nr:MAG TPA: Short C-terminal domain [Caudoviricetes sp.]